jgi:hypothetical protein
MNSSSNPSFGRTDRFLTSQIDIVQQDTRFESFLLSEIKAFVQEFPPIKENTNYSADLRNQGINIQRPINTRNISRTQIELMYKIRNKANVQLLAEGKVKQLIEKSIVTGFRDRDKLEKIVTEFSRLYGFDLDTQYTFKEIIDTYTRNLPIVEDFFKTRNNNSESVFLDMFGKDLKSFGVDSNGKPLIQVFQGPLGVELFCPNNVLAEFFKQVYGQDFKPLGFASTTQVRINGINFPIQFNFNTSQDPDTYFHELGHNWNRLFKNINKISEEVTEADTLQELYFNFRNRKNIDAWETTVKEHYKSLVGRYLVYFGDECLAMIKSNDSFERFFDQDATNPYDYSWKFRNSQSNSLKLDKDSFYSTFTGQQILDNDNPLKPYPGMFTFELDRQTVINIRQDLYNNYYLPTIKEITDKIKLILTKKPEIRKTLIGALGMYSEVTMWPVILDKIISDL